MLQYVFLAHHSFRLLLLYEVLFVQLLYGYEVTRGLFVRKVDLSKGTFTNLFVEFEVVNSDRSFLLVLTRVRRFHHH